MDFRPKLYKITICILVSIFLGYIYSAWHLNLGAPNYLGPFIFGSLVSFVVIYVIISLLEERW
jgi:hypothetical protein